MPDNGCKDKNDTYIQMIYTKYVFQRYKWHGQACSVSYYISMTRFKASKLN